MLRFADSPLKLELPLFSAQVPAGFPSPADDHIEGKLDLNEHLVRRPAATFFVRASGESMRGVGIFDGDLLTIDRSTTKYKWQRTSPQIVRKAIIGNANTLLPKDSQSPFRISCVTSETANK